MDAQKGTFCPLILSCNSYIFVEKERVLKQDEGKDESSNKFSSRKIADREDSYHAQRLRALSPGRSDKMTASSYADLLKENELEKERREVERRIQDQKGKEVVRPQERKRRWDMPTPDASSASEWDDAGGKGELERRRSRWDATPDASLSGMAETPRRSRWDETPVAMQDGSATPLRGEGSGDFGFDTGPEGFFPRVMAMTPDQAAGQRWDAELEARNRPLSDAELDAILPPTGYAILAEPAGYQPIRTPARKLMATPAAGESGGFVIPQSGPTAAGLAVPGQAAGEDLPLVRPEDVQYFGRLLESRPDAEMSLEEALERKIMKLLLRIKNGTPAQRRQSMRQLGERAREFGAGPLFEQLLPLLMSPSLEDQERHLLVKVIDRVLWALEEQVRPWVHKILVVVEPLLIEEDAYTRQEGREIIAALSKAAGLAPMIAALRPDLEHADEYVRNTTARALAVVGQALGVPAVLPFLRAVCASKRSWHARHTGIKVVQQLALLLGCGILPHLRSLVDCVAAGLEDEQPKVKTIAALALAALAEASAPHGIEAFDGVLRGLWKGLREHRGKALAALLKAVGQLVPLMDSEYAGVYAKDLLSSILPRHFATPDDEMKRIVLRVLKQCAATPGVPAALLRTDVLADFFRHFWVRRMALDRRNARALHETTVALAAKAGLGQEVLGRLLGLLKDEAEPLRRLAVEATGTIMATAGAAAELGPREERQLLDGLVYAFQEQSVEDPVSSAVVLAAFGQVLEALGPARVAPYLQQLASMVLWRLSNRSARVRATAADLAGRLAPSIAGAREDALLAKLSLALYENLGEEYPDVLASLLGALKQILAVIGMARMSPPIKDLLPRLTPILRNRHERVQENCIELVGRVADRAAEAVSAREWMRICFELLDVLRAPRKSVRRAAINAFGHIAKAIGPQDVLAALLNNLRVQERQNRVCTTIAIAIVAEACGPFTVLPALMNEYRVPELNVQNGVLKSLAFLFEYIGELGKDYVFAVTPLLEDALTDRDQVHRQTAAAAIKHIALGVPGHGCEEALLHLLNHLLPNAFDASPHLIAALMEAMEGLRVGLGPAPLMLYLVQGLFHPARRVRDIYWIMWNSLYIAAADALIPVYPSLQDEPDRGRISRRHVLDIVM